MIIIDKNAKREVQVKYPDRTRVLFPNLDDGYISSNDIVVPGINAPISADGVAVASINDGAEGDAISKLVIGIDPVQSGSGDPSPENVRPISGWTQAKVVRCGKNLVPLDGWAQGQLSGDSGIPNGVSYSVSSPFILLKGGKTYLLSRNYPEYGSGQMAYHTYTLDKIHVSDSGWVTNNQSISPSNDCYIRLTTRAKTNTENPPDLSPSDVGTVFTVQLEIGSTATAYEPYAGQQYTIDLNGTRYGGTLDVTTGVLTVDRGLKKASEISNWTLGNALNDETGFLCYAVNAFATNNPNTISNAYKKHVVSAWENLTFGEYMSSTSLIVTVPTEKNTTALAKAYLNELDASFVYELAEPLTVQLTAQEITTLLGQNNIWADCGNVLELSYSANMSITLQDLLNEKLDKPTIPGTLGQVLTSDGEGGQTWETPE